MERMNRDDLRAVIAAILVKEYTLESGATNVAKSAAAFAEMVIRASEDNDIEEKKDEAQ